jgi:hypothetical protein
MSEHKEAMISPYIEVVFTKEELKLLVEGLKSIEPAEEWANIMLSAFTTMSEIKEGASEEEIIESLKTSAENNAKEAAKKHALFKKGDKKKQTDLLANKIERILIVNGG